jgi:GNAT superfamily N-acetyltransferase
MTKTYIVPLNSGMNLNEFDSGNKDVDDFLKLKAITEQNQKITKIYVIQLENRVIAYIAIFCTHYRFLLPDQTFPFRVPGLFIGQLGVDKNYQGRGLGTTLIDQAIVLALQMSEKVGCRIVFLEAMDDKIEFYFRQEFMLIEKRTNRNKMYLDLLYYFKKQ